jgi:hypothetical protein
MTVIDYRYLNRYSTGHEMKITEINTRVNTCDGGGLARPFRALAAESRDTDG